MQIKITISLRCQGDIVLNHSLYESKPKDYLKILETLSDRYSHVLVVGHNPTIEETIEMLRDSSDDKILMPSCALAHLTISIGSAGNVTTKTLKAFTAEEGMKIIKDLS
jgi:phosphohistidine phosphatase SixA